MLDFYGISESLSDEERLVQRTVREFVDREVLPIIGEYFERGEFPTHLIPQLAELGLLGSDIPEYGAGLNHVSYGLINQELERGDSGLRSFVSVQTSLCMYPIWRYGSETQKRKYLPGMTAGKLIGCFGLTEWQHGSDPGGMETTARRDGDCYVINGGKAWITNGSIADLAIVWARTYAGPSDGDGAGEGEVRGFIVERGTPGFTARTIEHKLSLRASVTSELVFQDCRVPEPAILPGVAGLRGPLSCLNEARYGIAWGAIGAAMSCYETALEYSKARQQFDRPIAGFQLTQARLVDMLTEITKAQLLALQLGRLKDRHGKVHPAQVSMAKRNNVRMALEIAREARSVLGASGISLEFPIFRHMCNLESVYTYEGTHEVHTLTIGREITGLNAFK